MVKAITVHQNGGPEVLKWEDVEVPTPKDGEIILKQNATGLNFLNVYMRQGLYNQSPSLPFIPDMEGAGVVTSVGPRVTTCKVGDIVAYASPQVDSYAQERILPAALAVLVPSSVDPVEVAAVIIKGLTAHVLINKGFKALTDRSSTGGYVHLLLQNIGDAAT